MKYDVIVVGAGPSGMVAAISASRNGAKVLLVEASGLLGGNSILSLVGPWMTFHSNSDQIVKGIGGEIVDRLKGLGYSLGHIPDPIGFCDTITPVDVEGVKEVYFDYVEKENIDLLLHALVMDVIKDGETILGVTAATKSGMIDLYGTIIIDASGDADVAYKMGCPYMFGRGKDNLAQPMTMLFTVGDVDIPKIKEYMTAHPHDFVVGEGYKEEYLAVSGFFEKVNEAKAKGEFDLPRDRVLLFQEVRPNQVSINMTRVQSLRATDVFEMTKAEQLGRKQIKKAFDFLKKYIPGFENSYIVRTPSRIGIRETRHIIGEYLMEVEDVLHRRQFEDSICLAGFPIDIHAPSGEKLELFDQSKDMAYEIPLRSLLPLKATNLIVTGRCISATHEAAASLRVTPSVMGLGQAAGTLAALALLQNKTPKEVHYKDVQDILLAQGQIIKRPVK